MHDDRRGSAIRLITVALTLMAFVLSITTPSNAAGVRYGASMKIGVRNSSDKTIWLTPYGSTTLDPAWHIVSDHLACLDPGQTKIMDLYFPAATPLNVPQVRLQAEPGDNLGCAHGGKIYGKYMTDKCTKGGDTNLEILFEGSPGRFSWSGWKNCGMFRR